MKLIRVKKADAKKDLSSDEFKTYYKFIDGIKKEFFHNRIKASITFDNDFEPVEHLSGDTGQIYAFNEMEQFASEYAKAIKYLKEQMKKAKALYDAIPTF